MTGGHDIAAYLGLSPEWAITVYYMVAMFACAAAMKLSNALVTRASGRELWLFLLFSPTFS